MWMFFGRWIGHFWGRSTSESLHVWTDNSDDNPHHWDVDYKWLQNTDWFICLVYFLQITTSRCCLEIVLQRWSDMSESVNLCHLLTCYNTLHTWLSVQRTLLDPSEYRLLGSWCSYLITDRKHTVRDRFEKEHQLYLSMSSDGEV